MDTRKWLGRARSINREVEVLLRAKERTRDQLTRITQSYTGDLTQSTKDPHKYDRLAEIVSMIDEKVDELCDVRREIVDALRSVEDGRQYAVLFAYYIGCESLEEIAVEMHFSYASTKRYLRRGIDEISKNADF